MSIASKLQELDAAKDDIFDAIEAKGVTVPAGSGLVDAPALIGSIPGGGGGGDIGDNKISSNFISSTRKGFLTSYFNIEDAVLIEENIVFKASNWATGVQFSLSGGQWYSGTQSKFIGIAAYLYSDKLEFDYGDNIPEHYDFVTGISYDFSKIVRKNIVYNKNAGVATCEIYYDDTLVYTYTRSISDLYLDGSRSYSLLGNREGEMSDIGYIDINKSYILIDGQIVWGIYNK